MEDSKIVGRRSSRIVRFSRCGDKELRLKSGL